MRKIYHILFILFTFGPAAKAQIITTFAGTGTGGYSGDGGAATAAELYGPNALMLDPHGNLFISDATNNRVRMINPSGVITEIAGNGTAGFAGDGGPASAAEFNNPSGFAMDLSGNLYVADQYNQVIRKISPAINGVITTIAGTSGTTGTTGDGGPATAAKFDRPYQMSFDSYGNLFIVDQYNHSIRKITAHTDTIAMSDTITTIAGQTGTYGFSGDGGPATAAHLHYPNCVYVDVYNNIFISDNGNQRIRKINTYNIISTVAGDGYVGGSGDGYAATLAELNYPTGMKVDGLGNFIFGDGGGNDVRKVNSSGIISTICDHSRAAGFSGDGGPATAAEVDEPLDIAIDQYDDIYIADYANNRLRIIQSGVGRPQFVDGERQTFNVCENSVGDSLNAMLEVNDRDHGFTDTWTLSSGPYNGEVVASYSATTTGSDLTPFGLYYIPNTNYVGTDSFKVWVNNGFALDSTTIVVNVQSFYASIITPNPLSMCPGGIASLTSDSTGGSWASYDPGIATVSGGTVTGITNGHALISYTTTNSCGSSSSFAEVSVGNYYINTIAGNGSSGFSGDGGAATAAEFDGAWGLATDNAGNVYVGDLANNRVRKITPAGVISTVAGTGTGGSSGDGGAATAAELYYPVGVAVDAVGNLYIADNNNNKIRKVNTAGIISTYAGTGVNSFSGDGGAATAAKLSHMNGIAVDGAGNLYIGDTYNYCVREVNAASGIITTVAGTGTSTGESGDGRPATAAKMGYVNNVATDIFGDIYISDYYNYRMRKVNAAGFISTCAGTGTTGFTGDGGAATAAKVSGIGSMAVDSAGNVYFTDIGNQRIRIINNSGTINTFTGSGSTGFSGDGGPATAAVFDNPGVLAMDMQGNIFVNDMSNARIRKIYIVNLSNSRIKGPDSLCKGSSVTFTDSLTGGSWSSSATSIAEVGTTGVVTGVSAGIATISYTVTLACGTAFVTKTISINPTPGAITGTTEECVGSSGVVSDTSSGGVWSSASSVVGCIAGTGSWTGVSAGTTTISYTIAFGCVATAIAQVNNKFVVGIILPEPVTICPGSSVTLSVDTTGGTWSSGSSGIATVSGAGVVTAVSSGNALISYTIAGGCNAPAIALVSVSAPVITTIAGNGTAGYSGDGGAATAAELYEPWGIKVDAFGNVYFADFSNNRVRKISTSGTISTIAGNGTAGYSGDGGAATAAELNLPIGIAIDPAGDVYIGDRSNNRVRKVNASGIISTVAGNGMAGYSGDGGAATAAKLNVITGIALDAFGNLYIVDYMNAAVRKVDLTGIITTIAGTGTAGFSGDGGPATAAEIAEAYGVFPDATGNIFIADGYNNRIRKISNGIITTVAGGGSSLGDGGPATAGMINAAVDVVEDAAGNLYISDANNDRIRLVNTSGVISTIAGNGTAGFSGDGGEAVLAEINHMGGVALDAYENVYIGDWGNNRIRKIGTGNTNIPLITGLDSICVGTSATFTDSLGGGAWSSSATSVAEVNSSGVVSGVASGTALISYTVTYPCGPEVVSKAITINPTPSHITGTETVCAGHTTSISDALAGGNWHSNNLLVATIITGGNWTGMSVGTAIISYNMPTGCSTWCTVSVNATPAAISVTPVCPITGNYLTDATSGGLWSSTNSAVGTIFPVAGYFTGLIAGTTIISYTLATGCYAAAVETVFPNPADITGTTNVCQTGGTDTLSDSTMGGYWISSNLAVVEIDLGTGALTGDIPGTATITYTVLSTGCMAEATVTTVADPPPFTGITEVCIGNVDTLGNTDAGGTWSSGNSAIATIGSVDGIADGMSEGVVNITYTVPGGCYYTSSITVFPGPTGITGNRNICVGAGTVLSDVWPGGSWISGNPAVAAVVTATGHVTGISAGSAIITYQLATNCMAMDTVTVGTIPLTISGGTSMCSNATATWTDVVSGGRWSSSRTTVATIGALTGTVSGVSAGTTVITYGTSVACYVTKILSVNTGPKAIAGLTAMCSTATVTLADSITGGTWVSSRTAVATIGATSGTVTGVTDGTTIISYTLTDGCAAATLFTVAGGPLPIAGPGSACTGTVAALTDGIVGGSWSSLRTAVATIDSAGDATGIAAGTTIITYTIGGGCLTTFTLAVHAGPAPIMGAAALCEGQHTTYTDASGSGVWYSNPATVATITATTGALSGVGPGTTIITYQLSTGCSAADTVSITGHPAAITGAGTSCTGGLLTWTDSTAGGTWTSGRTAVAAIGSLSGTLTAVSAGTAIITYTVGSGCIATATVAVVAGPAAVTGFSTVCMSGTSMLSDATTGGTWSCPWYYAGCATITTGGMVAGVNPGSAVVTYTLPTGCATTDTITTVNAPDPITGNPVLCVGSSEALGEEVFGGVWTSSATGVAAVISHLGIIAGIAAGTATITYSLGTGCMVTYNLTIVPLPASISGSLQLCAGTTAAAYDSTPGGTWHTAATGISITATSGTLTALTAGSYEITYTLPTGCTAMAYATVNPLPASIGGTPALCAGDTATLHDATPGGTWTATGSHAAISATTGLLTGASPGTATISYTLGTACAATAIAVINPPPGPITGMAALCVGYTETLTNDTSGGAWTATGAAVTVNTTTGLVTALAAGTALVSYTTGAGCFVAAPLTVSATPAAITGPANACAGATGVYTDPVTGGTWSSSSVAAGTIGATTGLFAGITTGATTLTYTLPTGCYTLLTLAVNAIPAALSGTDSVCVGDSAHLADPTPGGLWSSSSVPVATVSATGWVMGVASGYSTISYTVGGCSNTVGFSVNRQPMYIGGPDSVCADGGYVRLWDGDSDEGYWSSRAIGVDSLGIVEGYSAGTATVTFTLRTGCATARVMNVEPGPDDVMGGSPYVCTGGSALYTDATPGGYWVISPATVATVGSATGMVTGAGTGTASVSYILPVTGCFAKRTVLVNPQPMAITGPEGVCVGMSTTYSDSTAGGTWSGSAPAIFAVDTASGLMTGITFGTGTITYTITDSCGTATTTAPVAVSPLPDAGVITGSAAICVGQSFVVTGTATGGSWAQTDSVATLAGTTVTGTAAGADTVLYVADHSGCIAMATWPFVVLAIPDAGAIAGPGSICAGNEATYTDDEGGGAWSASNTHAAISPTGVVQGLSAGADTLVYTVSNAACQATAQTTLTIDPQPDAGSITGPAAVCVGDSIQLTDTAAGGAWTGGNLYATLTGNAASATATGISAGIMVASYTAVNSCGAAMATDTLQVASQPDAGYITGLQSLCVGDSVQLYDKTPGGLWSVTDTIIARVTAGTVYGATAGSDTILYTVTNYCGSATATYPVAVLALPQAPVIAQGAVNLTVTGGYNSYAWTDNGTAAGTTDSAIAYTPGDVYQVMVTGADGCPATSATYTATDCAPAEMVFYPNPAPALVYIIWCKPVTVKIMCDDGRLVKTIANTTVVNWSDLPNATYMLEIFDEHGNKVRSQRVEKITR